MTERYFVESPISGTTARLQAGEAHHLAHVMRGKPGDEVVLFDGSGQEFTARVEQVGRSEIELSVLTARSIDRESPVEVTLGVALPKGDRAKWLIEKATELGVTRIIPLATERGNERPSSGAFDRLRRAVIEASKQCGRNRLLEIAPPLSWSELLSTAEAPLRLVAHPGGSPLSTIDRTGHAKLIAAIGPEGGFSDAEIEQARASGWHTIDLGPRILRIETAALAVVAAMG